MRNTACGRSLCPCCSNGCRKWSWSLDHCMPTSQPEVEVFVLRTVELCNRRDQRSVVSKSRKANRHAVVNSPMVCISLTCTHVVQAVFGLERRKPSQALTIGFSMRRDCQKLIRPQQFQQLMPILGPFFLRSRTRLPAFPIQGSVVSLLNWHPHTKSPSTCSGLDG